MKEFFPLLKKAIIYGAKKILCIHNHPSGDITPSQEDIRLTIKLKKLAEYFNVPEEYVINSKYSYVIIENDNKKEDK